MLFLAKMVIDELRQHVLTNFNTLRIEGKAIESNHNTELLKFYVWYLIFPVYIKDTNLKYMLLKLWQCSLGYVSLV